MVQPESLRRYNECIKMPLSVLTNIRKHRHEKLNQAYGRFNENLFNNKLPRIPVVFNNMMIKCAGLTKIYKDFSAKILISTVVCSKQEDIYNTLLHEMCHVAVFYIDNLNNKDYHGDEWLRWVNYINDITELKYGKITESVSRHYNWKYIYRCKCMKRKGSQIRKRKGAICKTCKSPWEKLKG